MTYQWTKLPKIFQQKKYISHGRGEVKRGRGAPFCIKGRVLLKGGGRGDWVSELVAFKSIVLIPKN